MINKFQKHQCSHIYTINDLQVQEKISRTFDFNYFDIVTTCLSKISQINNNNNIMNVELNHLIDTLSCNYIKDRLMSHIKFVAPIQCLTLK